MQNKFFKKYLATKKYETKEILFGKQIVINYIKNNDSLGDQFR